MKTRTLKLVALLLLGSLFLWSCIEEAEIQSPAIFSINTSTVDFGEVELEKSGAYELVILNKGEQDLIINNITFGEDTNGEFTHTGRDAKIPQNKTYTFEVAFTPNSLGKKEGTLIVDSSLGMHSIKLIGQAVPFRIAKCVINPAEHNFGVVYIGEKGTLTVEVGNEGNAELQIDEILLQGDYKEQFGLVGVEKIETLKPGGKAMFNAEFVPNDASFSTVSATVLLKTNIGEYKVELAGDVAEHLPVFTVSPKQYDFTTVTIGESKSQEFVVTNTGDTDLIILKVELLGDDAKEFMLKDGAEATIAPDKTKEYTVTYKPTTMDKTTVSAYLQFTTQLGTHKVELTGMPEAAPAPNFVASPSTYTFPATYFGKESSTTIEISNTGNAELTISSISLVGANADQFELENANVTSIPAGNVNKLEAVFAPTDTSLSSASARIKFVTNAGDYFVDLEGKTLVGTPKFSVSPQNYDFSGVEVGDKATKKFVITNAGDGDLVISNYVLSGDTKQVMVTDCKGTIIPNGTKEFTVTFAPNDITTVSANLKFITNDGEHSVSITGVPEPAPSPNFVATPAIYTFPETYFGKERSTTIEISNTGNAELTISSISLVGANADQFKLENAHVTSIAAGNVNKLEAVFAPTDKSLSGASARIKFVTNAGEYFIDLEGKTLVGTPELSVSPEEYDFGTVEVGQNGTTQIVAKNIGNADLTISDVALVGGKDVFSFSPLTLPLILAPNEEKLITVTFTPKDGTKRNTTMTISSNGLDAKVPMSGMGKVVATSVKIRFDENMNFDELIKGLNQDNIGFVFDAGGAITADTPDGEFALMMWPGVLNFDLTNKPSDLKGIKARISTNGTSYEFKLLDENKNELKIESFKIPSTSYGVGEEEVELTYSDMDRVKYVEASCLEGYIKYIVFEY